MHDWCVKSKILNAKIKIHDKPVCMFAQISVLEFHSRDFCCISPFCSYKTKLSVTSDIIKGPKIQSVMTFLLLINTRQNKNAV